MADTEQLRKMLDNLINDKPEQAQVHFHDYLEGKMQEVMKGVPDGTSNHKKSKKE